MAKQYYYLVASLPYLKFADQPAITKKIFLEECEKWLSPKEVEAILSLEDVHGTGESAFLALREWKEFDLSFRQGLLSYREERQKGNDKKGFVSGNALEAGNPLEMEMNFEKARWDFLENLQVGHYFDIQKIMIYFLQLGILVRLAKFDKDKGEAYFHEICEVKYGNEAGEGPIS